MTRSLIQKTQLWELIVIQKKCKIFALQLVLQQSPTLKVILKLLTTIIMQLMINSIIFRYPSSHYKIFNALNLNRVQLLRSCRAKRMTEMKTKIRCLIHDQMHQRISNLLSTVFAVFTLFFVVKFLKAWLYICKWQLYTLFL